MLPRDASLDDTPSRHKQDPPTDPGFYKYEGANQTLIFCLDNFGNWWAITSAPTMRRCVWGYIEQALSVETLVKIT